jgi:hypothetical protein
MRGAGPHDAGFSAVRGPREIEDFVGWVGARPSRPRRCKELPGLDTLGPLQLQHHSCGCDAGRFGLQLTSHILGPHIGVPGLGSLAEIEIGSPVHNG